VKYDIKNLEAQQRGLGTGVKVSPWTLVITVQVNGSVRLGEILTDVERRLDGSSE